MGRGRARIPVGKGHTERSTPRSPNGEPVGPPVIRRRDDTCGDRPVQIIEADLIRLRTREGMKVAKAKGRLRGKQPKLNPRQEAHMVALLKSGEYSSAELGDLFGLRGRPCTGQPSATQPENAPNGRLRLQSAEAGSTGRPASGRSASSWRHLFGWLVSRRATPCSGHRQHQPAAADPSP